MKRSSFVDRPLVWTPVVAFRDVSQNFVHEQAETCPEADDVGEHHEGHRGVVGPG
jgi:hypothetical protein